MQWFKHDSDAATDAKIKKLLMRYGADGYAIYFHCIELIVGNISEQNITFELEHDAEIIADNLKIQGTSDTAPVDRVNQIMRYIVSLGLFEESSGHITCYKILKRLDTSMTSNSKMRSMITEAKQNHDKVMINHDKVMQEETRIDKTRTEQKRIDNTPDKPVKHKYGTLQNILLTDAEKDRLERDFHELAGKAIQFLSEYKKEKDYKTKDDNLTIRRWVITAVKEKQNGTKQSYSKPIKDLSNGYILPEGMDELPGEMR
jgi:hypothetical protein